MAWHQEKHNSVTCSCGMRIVVGQLARHRTSKRHQHQVRARQLREIGLSDAEIGRQLKLSRAYIGRMLEEAA